VRKTKILHVSFSMDVGGGPLAIKRIVNDVTGQIFYVAGNKGVFLDHFLYSLPPGRVQTLAGRNLVVSLYRLARLCRKEGLDIVHFHGRGAAFFGRLLKLISPTTLIVYSPHGFFPKALAWYVRYPYLLIEWLFVPLTDRFHFVSNSELQTFQRYVTNIAKEKIFYIQNYIDYSVMANRVAAIEINTVPKFLFIGRFCFQKGVDILIDALAKVAKPLEVDIIGYGELEGEMRKKVLDLNLQDKVRFLGKVKDAASQMTKYNGLLAPSRFEGMPFTLLEAMGQRVPIIVTPCVGVVDLFESDYSYISEAIDANSFAKAIEKFIDTLETNEDVIKMAVDENFAVICRRFVFKAVESKFRDLYQLK
jgi:glycosyltransferase involved in cell wall biosynthesis